MSDSDLQNKLIEYQMLRQEIENVSNVIQNLETRKEEYDMIIESLSKIKEQKKDVLLPLASGVFLKADITGDGVLVNVGSNVICKKSFEESILYLSSQLDDLTNTQEQLVDELNLVGEKIHQLEHEIEDAQRQASKKK